jgi:hypothetical protein
MRRTHLRRTLLVSLAAFLLPVVGCADEGVCCQPNPSVEVTAAAQRADVAVWGNWTGGDNGQIVVTALQIFKGDIAAGDTIIVNTGDTPIDDLREQDAFFLTGSDPYQLILAGGSLTPRGIAAAVAGDNPYDREVTDVAEVEMVLPFATAAAELRLSPTPDGTSGVIDEVTNVYAGKDIPATGDTIIVPDGVAWDLGGESGRLELWLLRRTGPTTWETLLPVPYESGNDIDWSLLAP